MRQWYSAGLESEDTNGFLRIIFLIKGDNKKQDNQFPSGYPGSIPGDGVIIHSNIIIFKNAEFLKSKLREN